MVVGPDFEPPEAPVAEQWEATAEEPDPEVTTLSSTSDVSVEWWKVFNDPVLDELLQSAYRQNLTLQTAGIQIYQARAQLGIAVGDQYPQSQQVGAGYSRRYISENVGVLEEITEVIDIDRSFDQYELGFDAGWELDFWGKFRRGIESADANLVAQIATYDDVLVSLTGEVASTYAAIRTFQERLAITKENVALQTEALRITKVRFKNGVTTELDVQEAAALLYDTEAQVPELEIGLRQAKNALSILLGVPPGELPESLDSPGQIPQPPTEVVIGVPAELLKRRPDIRAAELQTAAQSAQIGVAQADLYPSVTLAGSVGFASSDIGDLFQGRSVTGLFNPAVSWNFLNYGRIRNNVRVQDALLQELIINYQNTVLNAYLEVENAMVAFVQSQRTAESLALSVDASQRAVKIAMLQYQDGTADYTRVLNTQSSLARSQDRLTATRGAVVNNLIALYKGLGGGWQIRKDQDFIPEATRETMENRTNWGDLLGPNAVPKDDDSLDPPPSPEPFTLIERRPDW